MSRADRRADRRARRCERKGHRWESDGWGRTCSRCGVHETLGDILIDALASIVQGVSDLAKSLNTTTKGETNAEIEEPQEARAAPCHETEAPDPEDIPVVTILEGRPVLSVLRRSDDLHPQP